MLPPHRTLRVWKPRRTTDLTETPLDPRNQRVSGNGNIGDPKRLEATLVIDQAEVDLIRVDPSRPIKVEMQLDELPGQTLTGTIADVGALDLKIAWKREL